MSTNNLYAQILEKIETHWNGLPDKPEETPVSTLKALWLLACEMPVSAEKALEMELPETVDAARLEALVEKRLAGEPLAYLTGRQNFMGIEMLAGPEAMIPRKETEILGRAAVALLQELAAGKERVWAVDVCTGSGNMPVLLATMVKNAIVTGVDIEHPAVELACRNVTFQGLEQRVTILQGDLFGPVNTPENRGTLDMITCNPPYMSSKRVDIMAHEIQAFEPRPAFDGGPFGISILTRVVRDALELLRAGGVLCFEVGLGQGEVMARMVEKTGAYTQVRTYLDETVGAIRAISAVKL